MGILNRLWARVWDAEESVTRVRCETEVHSAAKDIREKWDKHRSEAQKACLAMGGPEKDDDNRLRDQMYNNLIMQNNLALQNQNMIANSIGQNSIGQPLIYTAGGIAQTTTNIYQGSTTGQFVNTAWPTFGDTTRDVFFKALKGIEEAAMKKPDGNHAYDDLAYAIQDMRYFNGGEISLIGVVSFCVSNLIDPNGIILLLEGHGMRLV